MERTLWLAFILATWGLANFLMKIVGVRIDAASAVIGIVLGYAIAGIAVAVTQGGTIPRPVDLLLSVLIGACFILGNWAYVRLARTEPITTIAPITGLNIAIPIILGILVLSEVITVRKGIGILLAAISIYLLAG